MLSAKYTIFIVCIMLVLGACKKKTEKEVPYNPKEINESEFVTNDKFSKGDVRRYGVFADSLINPKNIETILDLAESGLEIKFPKGFYKTSLILRGRTNTSIYFDDASFSGQIQIIEGLNKAPSQRINFKGKLTTYTKFFSKFSEGITIDTLIIASDTLKNESGMRSLGCSLYAGTKNVSIKKLVVEDLGSGDDYYMFSLAALQIHGWNNNPENININETVIDKSDRHGIYITGNNHKFGKIVIKQVGLGTIKINNGLEDADSSEIDTIASLWINKCQSSFFDNVIINCKDSKGQVTVNFDEGASNKTSIIDFLTIKNNIQKTPMLPNDMTNIVVRHFKEDNE